MGYNKKILSDAIKKLNERKAPSKPKDIPLDVKGKGMLDSRFAGKPVKLNTDTLYNPTPYQIKAVSDNGIEHILNPFDESNVYFPGATTITEYPIGEYTDKYLTDKEIEEYRRGGYIVEELDDFAEGGQPCPEGFQRDPVTGECLQIAPIVQKPPWYPEENVNPAAYVSGFRGGNPKMYKYGFLDSDQGNIVGGGGFGFPKPGIHLNALGVLPISANDRQYFKGAYEAGISKDFKNLNLGLGVGTAITGYPGENGFVRDPIKLQPKLNLRYNFEEGGIIADLSTDQIQEYAKGGYIVEELPEMQPGGPFKPGKGYKTPTLSKDQLATIKKEVAKAKPVVAKKPVVKKPSTSSFADREAQVEKENKLKGIENKAVDEATWIAGRDRYNKEQLSAALSGIGEITGINSAIRTGERIIDDPLKFAGDLTTGISQVPETLVEGAMTAGSYLFGDNKNYVDVDTDALGVAADVFDALPVIGTTGKVIGKVLSKGSKNLATKVDNLIYPTRAYRSEGVAVDPKRFSTKDEATKQLAQKVGKKGDWATKDLEESYQYLRGLGFDESHGLLSGNDVKFTEYKIPFWKKDVSVDPDVIALKKLQGAKINSNEYTVPSNTALDRFLYPRRTNIIKGIPEHVKSQKIYPPQLPEGIQTYHKGTIPRMPDQEIFSSPAYKYVEDQLNAVTGHEIPITHEWNSKDIPMTYWQQPQFAPNEGVGKFTRFSSSSPTTSKNILSDYRNIEELRLANKMKDYADANKNFATLFPDKQIFNQTKKEAADLLNKYKPEFIKKFGKGTDEEVLLYGAHKDLGDLPTNQNFLADDEFAKSAGLTNNLSNQNKFLSDAYQLEFSGHFNKNLQTGDNRQFSEYLSDQFEPVITTNKLNRPVQVKRTSNFSRPIKTMREGNPEPIMLKYDELQEGDIIYPEHNWSTTSDIEGDVWGSGSPTSKVARINLPAGQSTLRPNMYKGTQYANEEELVLPSKLGYKVSGINPQGFGDDNPRFIFDAFGSYKNGGYINKMSKGGESSKVISYLISQGLTKQQAAGIAGNLQQESSFRPNAKGSLGHIGIAQWDKNDRWPKVKKYIESQGLEPFSLDGQLAGLVWEAKKRKDWDKILKTKTPEESAQTWLKYFEISGEKPGQKGYDNRLKYAKNLAGTNLKDSPFDESVRDRFRLDAYREAAALQNKAAMQASNEVPYSGMRYNPTSESSSNIDPLLADVMKFDDNVTLEDVKPKTESSNLFASLLNMISAQEKEKEKEQLTEDPRQEVLKLLSNQYPLPYSVIGNNSHQSYVNPYVYANNLGSFQKGGATVKSPMASYYPSSKTQNAKSSDIKKSKSCGKGLIYDFEKQKCVPEKELLTKEEQLVLTYLKDRETDPSLGIMIDPYTEDLQLTSTRPAQSQFTMGPQSAGTGDAFWQAAVLGPGIAKGAASLIGRAAPYATAPLTIGSRTFPHINLINTIGLGFGAHSGANFFDSESATRQSLSKAYDNPTAENILDATGNVTMDALGVLTSPGMGGAMTAGANYLTKGPLKNADKINPFAFKEDPNKFYRQLGNEGLENALNTKVIKSADQATYPRPYFVEGKDISMLEQTGSGAHGRPTVMFETSGVNKEGMPFLSPANASGEYTPWIANMGEVPVSEGRLLKKHWWQGYKEVKVPKELPGSPKVVSSVDDVSRVVADTPQPWQIQELPGLHLKSTMSDGAISKIVEPKTGLINTEQALAIIGKESGGPDKVALIRQRLGNNIPKKMDFNEFRKVVQDQLIPLERQFATHSSDYGIDRIGYSSATNVEANIDGTFNIFGNPTKFKTRKEAEEFLKLQSPLENQTLILGNKGNFGGGSSAHGNPDETLGHVHFLRDAEHPDILIGTQIQSDAFQGTHRIMPKNTPDVLKAQQKVERLKAAVAENKKIINEYKTNKVDASGHQVHKSQIDQLEDITRKQEQDILFTEADAKNFTQKQLLDKNHQERYLQEFMDYAGKRGDVNYIAIPKPETAAKIQGYKVISNESIGPVTKKQLDASSTFEEFLKMKQDGFQGYNLNNEELTAVKKVYNDYKLGQLKPTYEPQHQTILKKYAEYEKMAKKLEWETEDITIKGNVYTKIKIPKSFKAGKGQIKAFSTGGTMVPSTSVIGRDSLQEKKQGGIILELDDDDIKRYLEAGYNVEQF